MTLLLAHVLWACGKQWYSSPDFKCCNILCIKPWANKYKYKHDCMDRGSLEIGKHLWFYWWFSELWERASGFMRLHFWQYLPSFVFLPEFVFGELVKSSKLGEITCGPSLGPRPSAERQKDRKKEAGKRRQHEDAEEMKNTVDNFKKRSSRVLRSNSLVLNSR